MAHTGNPVWFTFQDTLYAHGALSEEQCQLIETSLRGQSAPTAISLQNIPNTAIKVLVMQAWHLLHYQWQEVLNIQEQWTKASRDSIPHSVETEQNFIALVAKSNIHNGIFEAEYHANISHEVSKNRQHDLAVGFIVEKSAIAMSCGLYREALRVLQEAQSIVATSTIDGKYWLLRLQIVAGICNEALGNFAASGVHLHNQKLILKNLPHPLLWAAYARRQLSHYIESEQLSLANEYRESIDVNITQCENAAVQAMYLYECFRLHLEIGNTAKAQECFARREALVRDGKIPKSFLSLSHERCELALLKNDPESAAKIITSELWWIQKSQSSSAQALALYTLSRAHMLAGNYEPALQNAQIALTFAQQYDFGRTNVRILFLALSLSLKLADKNRANQYLQQLKFTLGKIALPLHRDFLFIVEKSFFNQKLHWSGHEGLLAFKANHRFLVYWAEYYGFSLQSENRVRSLFNSIESLSAGQTLFDPNNQCLVFWNEQTGTDCINLYSDSLTAKLILILLKRQNKALTPAKINQLLWKSANYHPHRHASRIHSLIKETRKILKKANLAVTYDNNGYKLESQPHFVVISNDQTAKIRTRKETALPKYKEQILLLLQKSPQSGAQLATQLNLTRQSLHPVLKKMMAQDLIEFVKCGRYSVYSKITKPNTEG